MAIRTSDSKTIELGGIREIRGKIGYIEQQVTIPNGASGNDRTNVFLFNAATLVLSCGFEVKTASGNAVTASLGHTSDGAGSATTLAGELATNGAVGTKLASGVTAPVLVAAEQYLVTEVSADPGNDTVLRVWAIVADIGDVSGL